jgi:hypothetical protein
LFALVSRNSAGYASITVSVIGILFTAASVRSILTNPEVSADQARAQAGLVLALLVAFGCELGCGFALILNDTTVFGPTSLSYVLIALLLLGIARAWELVGNRDTGIVASLMVLAGLDRRPVKPVSTGHADGGGDSARE